MGYLDMSPPTEENRSVTVKVWIPIELTTEKGQDDIINFAGKDLDEYIDIIELKAYIKELTNQNK